MLKLGSSAGIAQLAERRFCKANVGGPIPSAGSNMNCPVCGNQAKKYATKYCSNRCQRDQEYKEYILCWKNGLVNGSTGIFTKNISGYIKRYLSEKFGRKCSICGWNMVNPSTNKVPLEIDHINGSSEDNRGQNLRLICPNCHSLSPNFRNLNKGHGRQWRTKKYLKKVAST